ncbi:MAG: two-component system sensor histidine kinase/response regulator [Candidatus Azotimanducaceae bacterium]
MLVAEDNEFNQDVIREILEQWGIEVDICGNGFEALQQLSKEPYDIVLMDVQMPVMDGYEATRAIQATPSLAGQCVIAMTANVMPEDRQRCTDAGMNDFEPKPIDQEHLFQTLTKWLPEVAEVEAIDLTVLGRLLKDDPSKINIFAQKFLQSSRTVLAEMQVAQKNGDLDELRRLGHKHKSAAASAGASGVVDLCLAIEGGQISGGNDEQTALLLVQMQELVDLIALQLEREMR